MSDACIIAVAITGTEKSKALAPSSPISVAEQIESAQAAFEAGASLVHCHVRDDVGRPSLELARFARLKEGLAKHCPGMIVELSTGGPARAAEARLEILSLEPDMASLAVGSTNFASSVLAKSPDLVASLAEEMRRRGIVAEIEIFDLSHLFTALEMNARGAFARPPFLQFVFGAGNGLALDRPVFDFYLKLLGERAPALAWCAAAMDEAMLEVHSWCLAANGHLRTGFEDSIWLEPGVRAPSNAALVERCAALCEEAGRPVADWRQARAILGLAEP